MSVLRVSPRGVCFADSDDIAFGRHWLTVRGQWLVLPINVAVRLPAGFRPAVSR